MYERSQWPDIAELYRGQRAAIRSVVDEAAAAGADVETTNIPACPDWNVAQLAAHLAGAPAALLFRSYPGDDANAWVASHVVAREGRSTAENLDEWDTVGVDYDALLAKNEPAWGALAYDSVAHEHDLREALDLPGNREGRAIDYAVDRALGQLDTKARDRGIAIRIEAGDDSWTVGDDDSVVATLSVPSRWQLVRTLGSRRSESQVRAAVTGDADALLALLPWGTPAADSTG